VRRHHQEDHVVHDVGVGEAVAVLVLGMAQHREHVGAVGVAALLLDPLDEVVFEHLAGLQSAPPLERRDVGPDDRAAGPGGGGERLVHLGDQVVVGAGLVAHEHHRRDVEGEFLHRRVEQEAGVVGRIAGHHRRRHRVDVVDVAGEPAAGERLLHDPAVIHVLFEVEHHQAAVEERPDHRVPAFL
jgi:hypothetical protein